MNKLEMLKQLSENSPTDPTILFSLAIAYKYEQMHVDALQVLKKAQLHADLELSNLIQKEINAIDEDFAETEEDEQIEESGIRLINSDNTIKFNDHKKSESQTIDFSQVGGLDELKHIISMKIIKPFQAPELFSKFMKKTGGGLLLYGPPGCGKTFIAKATAGQCDAHFRSVKISDIIDPYYGVAERNVADVFSTARAKKPCILFFDEIDALGYNRSKISANNVRNIVDSLLLEIEGVDTNTDKLLIIGATNMPWDVDPAFRRPGRFDKSIFVQPPDQEARKVIFKLKIQDRPVGILDYDQLVRETNFFSGADIEYVVEQASETVLNLIFETGNENLVITQDVLMDTIKNTKPSTIEWLRTISTYLRYANQTGFYDDVDKYLSRHKGLI